MMGLRIQMWRMIQIIGLVVVGVFCGTSNEAGAANEQRCAELGSNCVCSEPLNTNTYTQPTTSYFNPADTTTSDKQCTRVSSLPGTTLEDGSGFRYLTVNSGEAINALPAGHNLTWILRGQEGGGGQFLGHVFDNSAPTARRAIRFYKYFSPNFDFIGDNGCTSNSNKIAQFFPGPIFTSRNGTWSFYAVESGTGWNLSTGGCCTGPGPGNTSSVPDAGAYRGKWIRLEYIISNAATSGAPTFFLGYLKNVTDNTPEIQIIDSRTPTNYANGLSWTTEAATTLHPKSTISDMAIDMFRTCGAGYHGESHFLAAAWSTENGQRIGASVEIEAGGGGDTSPPAPPTNLKISALTE